MSDTVSASAFPCKLCTKSYKTAYGLRQHVKVSHKPSDPTNTCQVCFQTLYSVQKLRQHKSTYQHFTIDDVVSPQTLSFLCPQCNFQTDSQSKLNCHNMQKHSTVNSDTDFLDLLFYFECPYRNCNAKTYSKTKMQYHFMTVHSSAETFHQYLNSIAYTNCQNCNVDISNENYKTHLLSCKKH